MGSTASTVNFADGTQFSATAPVTTTLLQVSVPLGLQYGGTAGGIQVQGNGQGTRTTTDLIDTTIGLRVEPNQTLALVGGNVALEGGTLKTAGGRIELGSVAGAGLVKLTPINTGWALGYSGVPTFGDIQLSQQAAVDASGAGGGDITVWGRRVTLKDGSQIQASTLGSEPAGTLSVTTSESVEAIGLSADGRPSGLLALVYPEAKGSGGNLTIETARLIVRDGAVVNASTFGLGAAGTLAVMATESVEVIGESADGQVASGLATRVGPGATGAGGNLTIETGRLIVRDGAVVSASTFGSGAAGNLIVTASESVELFGISALDSQFGSSLAATVQPRATGPGGNISIQTRRLVVQDGSAISTATFGSGAAGTLAVSALESVELIGTSADGQFPSELTVSTSDTGSAGDLTIETEQLTVRDGAAVSVDTFGEGNAGNLLVQARDSVEVVGKDSFLVANGEIGNGGNLTVETERLSVSDGAEVSASTFGVGDAGVLTIRASDSVEVRGEDSGLFADVTSGARGNGGDLRITTGQLNVRDGAQVTVSSKGSGDAGNLQLTARSIRLSNKAFLSSETTARQGNIFLRSGDLVLRHGSNIATDATSRAEGGNITIDTDILVALENSDISANAQNARGGQVVIDTQGIFGTEFRSRLTPESDITATSSLGLEFSGTVELNTPEVDPSAGLVALPAEVVNAPGLIATGCEALGENEFIITGRGGLPPSPSDPLRAEALLADWVTLEEPKDENRSGAAPSTKPTRISAPTQIVEAQGWVINNKGEVVLTANAPSATPHSPWMTPANCHTSQNSS